VRSFQRSMHAWEVCLQETSAAVFTTTKGKECRTSKDSRWQHHELDNVARACIEDTLIACMPPQWVRFGDKSASGGRLGRHEVIEAPLIIDPPRMEFVLAHVLLPRFGKRSGTGGVSPDCDSWKACMYAH
jgi:hypothetical protein